MGEEVIIQNISVSNIRDRKQLLEDIKRVDSIMSKWTDTEIVLRNIRLRRGKK